MGGTPRNRWFPRVTVWLLVTVCLVLTPGSQAIQIGLHEAATGTTDAYLQLPNRPLLTTLPTGNYNSLVHTSTTVSAGQLVLAKTSSTTTVTDFSTVGSATNVSVQAGKGLKFPGGGLGGVAVAGTQTTTFAVGPDGYTYGWGNGVIGDNTASGTVHSSPTRVFTGSQQDASGYLKNIATIAAGQDHALAVDTSGNVWAWGANGQGQLGLGNTTVQQVPRKVLTGAQGDPSGYLTGIVQVTGGYLGGSMALDSAGCVWGWGYNAYGQIGDGTTTGTTTPVKTMLSGSQFCNIRALAEAAYSVIAIDNANQVWFWGAGALGGDGTNTERHSPTRAITGAQNDASGYLSNIQVIGASIYEALAIDSSGNVWGWGSNSVGNLGIGNFTAVNRPYRMKTGDQGDSSGFFVGAKAVGCIYTTCFVANATRAFGMGRGVNGVIGNGNAADSNYNTPQIVLTGQQNSASGKLEDVAGFSKGWEAAADNMFSIFVAQNGTVYSAGRNINGHLGLGSGDGDGSSKSTPQKVVPGEETGQGAQFKTVVLEAGSSKATAGSFTSTVITTHYDVTSFNDTRTIVANATATLQWRSGWTQAVSAFTWTDWTTSVPSVRHYYQYRYMFQRPGNDTASNATVKSLTVHFTEYPTTGNAVSTWTVPNGASASSVTLRQGNITAANATVKYQVKKASGDAYSNILPGGTFTFSAASTTVILKVLFTAEWDTPVVTDATLTWTAAGDTTLTGATTRTSGSTSETNRATGTPTVTQSNFAIIIPVSTKVTNVLNVTVGATRLTSVGSIAAVTGGKYYFDPLSLFVYVGFNATSGTAVTRWVNASYGATFALTTPTLLASGEYYTVSGTIRGADGTPITGVLASINFYASNGTLAFGPFQRFVVSGNLEASVSTNYLKPGNYNVTISFNDNTGVTFVQARSLQVGAKAVVNCSSACTTSYSNAEVVFNFFNQATGFGMDPSFLKVLASDTGSPTSSNRIPGNRFETSTGLKAYYKVQDYWGQQVYPLSGGPANLTVTSKLMFVDVGLSLADFKVKNTNASVINMAIIRGATQLTTYVLPQEIVDFPLLPNAYTIRLDYYNSATGAFQKRVWDNVSVTTDVFYWIKGHDLADIVIEINNVGANVTNQFVNIGVRINNVNSTIQNQIVGLTANITNLRSNITNQFLSLQGTVLNVKSVITNQITVVKAIVNNTNSSIHTQLNQVYLTVRNTETNITTQLNAIVVDIRNTNTTIHGQLNSIQVLVTNVNSTLVSQTNTILNEIRNSNATIVQQANLIRATVTNINATITTQFNSIHTQVSVFESNVTNLITLARTDISYANSTIVNRIDALNNTVIAGIASKLDGLENNVTNRLVNRTDEIKDDLDTVMGAIHDINVTGVAGVLSKVDEVLLTFRAPHLIASPGFTYYEGFANDTLPPVSWLIVSQSLAKAGDVVVSWGASDNALVLNATVEYRKKGAAAWTSIGTSVSGSTRVGGLVVGDSYEFRSYAVDAKGNAERVPTATGRNFKEFIVGQAGVEKALAKAPSARNFLPAPSAAWAVAAFVVAIMIRRSRANERVGQGRRVGDVAGKHERAAGSVLPLMAKMEWSEGNAREESTSSVDGCGDRDGRSVSGGGHRHSSR